MRDVALMPVHHREEMPTVLLSGSDSADLLIGISQKGVEFPAESAAARHLRTTDSSRRQLFRKRCRTKLAADRHDEGFQ